MKKALTKLGVGSVIALGLAINPLTGVQAVFAASDASNFEGFNAQAGVGYQASQAALSGISGGSINGANLSQQTGSSVATSIGLGYTKAVSDNVTAGVELEYNPVNSDGGKGQITGNNGSSVSQTGKFTFRNQTSVAFVPGYAVTPSTLVYAKAGYAFANLKTEGSNGSTFNNTNLNGLLIGLGVRTNFDSNWYGFAEANTVQYGNQGVSGTINQNPGLVSVFSNPRRSSEIFCFVV